MTRDEYRNALLELERRGKFRELKEHWGGGKETVEKTVEAFASNEDPARWERIAIFHLERLGIYGLKTEDEKTMEATQEAARSARMSAESSAISANVSKWALGAAAVAILVSILVAILT